MKKYKILYGVLLLSSLLIVVLFSSCKNDNNVIMDEGDENTESPLNILLIIADDMGLDATNGYAEGSEKPNTPHLDSIRNTGLKFNNLWVNPTCSPTRSSIISGKYGYTTGVLNAGDDLSTEHFVLQKYINEQTGNKYATAVVGKWHLGPNTGYNPEILGIDYYAGLLSGGTNNYNSWNLIDDTVTTTETEYITQKFTNLSIDWVEQQTKPWFLWLSYTAPHTPFHLPPEEMHSQGILPDDQASIDANPLPYYLASIEAMDYQIGRLFDKIGEEKLKNTLIIFIGDNGTPAMVAQPPYSRFKSKGSIYQGGINTPMFISGPPVNRVGTEEALINGTDLFATIAGLAGVNIEEINDSKNFESLFNTSTADFREHIYSEIRDDQNGIDSWCIRDASYKLLEFIDGSQEFYNLVNDPYETNNLLDAVLSENESVIKSKLENAASEIRL